MSIATASFSPDATTLVTGSFDGYLIEWDGLSGAKRRVLLDPRGVEDANPRVVSVDPQFDPGFQLVRPGESMRGSSILCVRFSPDGSLLAVGAANGIIVVWNAESFGEILSLTSHGQRIDALAFSHDNRWIAAGCYEAGIDSLRVWQLKWSTPFDSSEAFVSDRHVGGVSCVCFSPDDRFLAAGGFMLSGYTGPFLYDVTSGKRVASLLYDMTRMLDYSPDGKLVATGDEFGSVRFWDAAGSMKPLFEEKVHGRPVGAVVFSRDGRRLVTGSWDGTVQVWDVEARAKLARYTCDRIVLAIRFAADDRGLIVAGTVEKGTHPDIFRFP